MNAFRQKRVWFWIAMAAIAIALIALIVPHGHRTAQSDWLALLPVFFIGLIVPFTLAHLVKFLALGRTPESPLLAPTFQRPPPFRA